MSEGLHLKNVELLYPLIQATRLNKSKSHQEGTCGGIAGLCYGCYQAERDIMKTWVIRQPDPEPGEDYLDYAKRIGMPFYDSWAEVAQWRIRQLFPLRPEMKG